MNQQKASSLLAFLFSFSFYSGALVFTVGHLVFMVGIGVIAWNVY